jgi:hypothetical protein
MPLVGHCEPRIYTRELRPLTPESSRGFAFIDWCENRLGWQPTAWQKWLSIHALEVMPADPDRYRFRTIVCLLGRQ